jgi:hypothetical protein
MSPWIRLDPCPDSMWELLPGGREARNDVDGEVWQYIGTFVRPDCFSHSFRHNRHPLYDGRLVWASVRDHDAGPRLYGTLVWLGGWDSEMVTFDEFGNEVFRG